MAPVAKRRKTSAVEEITFDTASRADYLTGFHKRKQARIKHSQELALKREKEEKRSQREALREQRKKDLEEHVRLVNEQMKAANGVELEAGGMDAETGEGMDGEWAGIQEVPVEAEWVDEDQYATVTVEEVDITREGFVARGEDEDSSGDEGDGVDGVDDGAGPTKAANGGDGKGVPKTKRPWSKEKPDAGKPKRKKSRNFKYESKVDRRATRAKQRSKNKAQAMARKARAP